MPPSQTARPGARQGARPGVRLAVRQAVRRTSQEETEQLQELYKLLTAKDFQTRMKGVLFLLDLCKGNLQLVSTNIVQVGRASPSLLSH